MYNLSHTCSNVPQNTDCVFVSTAGCDLTQAGEEPFVERWNLSNSGITSLISLHSLKKLARDDASPSGFLSFSSEEFTLNRSCFLDIWQCWHPTSPILLIICSQSCRGGGLQGRSVGYPSCQSNVTAVRGVADLVWKVLLVIKILHEGWVLISEKLSVFPQLSCCLCACCHMWTTPQAWWSRDTVLLCHNEE